MNKRFWSFLGLMLLPFQLVAVDMQQNGVDQAIIDLGIDINMSSDPKLLKKILAEDMFLADVPGIKDLLGKKLKEPQPLKPLIMSMRDGILAKHPAIDEMLREAHKQNLLPKVDAKRILNHMFIFDDIVQGMARDHQFMMAVHQAFLKKRATYDIGEGKLETALGIYQAGGGMFGAAKAVTMDDVLKMYGDIRTRGAILEEETTARINGLKLNIFEAYSTDKFHLNFKNAKAALALMSVPPETVRVVGPETRVQYVYNQLWTSLYHTWNGDFIFHNLDNLHLLLPKLAIPAVANAESNDYLFMRSLALWTSLNFSLFAKLEQRENVEFANAKAIAKLWSRINLKYAVEYLKTVEQTNLKAKALLLDIHAFKKFEDRWTWFSGVLDGFNL